MPVHDPDKFVQAMKKLAEENNSPYRRLLSARGNIGEAELPVIALGLGASFFVKEDYDGARRFFHTELDVAADNLKNVLDGLQIVAKNYHTAEQANILDPDSVKDSAAKIDFSTGDIKGGAELVATGFLWTLAIRHMFIGTALKGAGQISVAAGISTALWLLCTPLDTELSDAQSKWESAAEHLNQFILSLSDVMPLFAQAWYDSEGADMFTKYMTTLKNEIHEGALLVAGTASTLKSIHNHLVRAQTLWFGYSMAVLILLIWLQATQAAAPPTAGAVKVVIELVGGTLGKAVGSWIGLVGETSRAVLISAGLAPFLMQSFTKEKKAWSYGGTQYDGLDLKSARMSTADLDVLMHKY
ncbi:hypothetical protein [Actinopolymorpha pittospori]